MSLHPAENLGVHLPRRIEDLTAALLKPGADERLALARSALGIVPVRSGAAATPERRALELSLLEAVARVRTAGRVLHSLPRARDRARHLVAARLRDRAGTGGRARARHPGTRRRPSGGDRGARARFRRQGRRPGLHPPQCLQCLALADSLARLGLSRPDALSITAFDISARVLDHFSRARQCASAGQGYSLQLPRPREGWGPALVRYRESFGDSVASAADPVKPPPAAGDVVMRAVRVRPAVVGIVEPRDLNVVYQRLDLPAAERFDLVVATNILVDYDRFEQALALANVASMTAVGGLLLSSNAVLELPESKLRSVDYKTACCTRCVVRWPSPSAATVSAVHRRCPSGAALGHARCHGPRARAAPRAGRPPGRAGPRRGVPYSTAPTRG